MSIKPFLLIFVPYLLLRRKFRAAATACSIVAVTFALGFLLFGMDSYKSWTIALSAVDWPWAVMNASIQGILSRALAPSPYFVPLAQLPGLVLPVWLVLAGLVGVLTLALAVRDWADHAVDRAFALLLLGALLISPLGWIYYLWLAIGPVSVLVHSWFGDRANRPDWKAKPLERWKAFLFFGSFAGLLVPYPLTLIFYTKPLAAVLSGSLYFWSIIALWTWVVVDFYSSRALQVPVKHPRS